MVDHSLYGGFQFGPVGNAVPCYMVSTGEGDEVRAGDIHERIAFVVEELLPLADHAKEAVVQDEDLDIDVKLHDGAKFLKGHLETPVTDDGNDCAIRCAKFGADCRR